MLSLNIYGICMHESLMMYIGIKPLSHSPCKTCFFRDVICISIEKAMEIFEDSYKEDKPLEQWPKLTHE